MTTEKWIEDFDKKFNLDDLSEKAVVHNKVKSFISTLLEEQRKEIMDCIPRFDLWKENGDWLDFKEQLRANLKAKHLIK